MAKYSRSENLPNNEINIRPKGKEGSKTGLKTKENKIEG